MDGLDKTNLISYQAYLRTKLEEAEQITDLQVRQEVERAYTGSRNRLHELFPDLIDSS